LDSKLSKTPIVSIHHSKLHTSVQITTNQTDYLQEDSFAAAALAQQGVGVAIVDPFTASWIAKSDDMKAVPIVDILKKSKTPIKMHFYEKGGVMSTAS